MNIKVPKNSTVLETAKKSDEFLNQPPAKLKEKLINFKKEERLTPEVIKSLAKYINDPNDGLNPEVVAGASAACKAICLWIRAMYDWYTVNLKVIPLKESLAEATAQYNAAMKDLKEKQASLKIIVDKLELLEKNLAEANASMKKNQD